MANPITVGLSGITNTIWAGRSKPLKGGNPDARVFTGEKRGQSSKGESHENKAV